LILERSRAEARLRMVSAAIGTVFVQDSADAARTQWRSVANQLRGKSPSSAT
jgi:putative transposase